MYKLKRLLSFIMAMLLTVSLLPAQVFAAEETAGESSDEIAVAANEVTTEATDILDGKVTVTYTTAGGYQGYFKSAGENAWLYGYDNEDNTEFVSTQLVITNNTEELLNFACSLADAEASYLTIGGASAESVPSPSVEPNASLELVLNVAGGEWPELTLSDFAFSAYTESGVSFVYDVNLGSITVGGASVESGYSQEVDANGVQLEAEPSAGVTFLGWINAETGKLLSASSTYNYKPTGENIVTAAFASADSAAWFYANNKQNLFDDLNAAVDCAENANNKTIILAADGSLFEGDYTISSGVTLLIPYDASYTLDADVEPTLSGQSQDWFTTIFTQEPISASVAFRTLRVKSGAVINVEGNLNVNSAVFAVGSRDTGNPHGPYGLMVLENNAELKIANGGKLYCYGFIIGTYAGNGSYTGGKVVAQNAGSVYELFQIRDLGGADRMQAEVDAFPMTQYYVQNIEAKYEILPGATSSAIISARNSYTGGQQDFPFIGMDSGLFRLTAGKLTRVYDPVADRIEYTLGSAGAMSVDELVINLKNIYTVRSSNYYLAINGNLGITLESGTSATVNQKVKLLPGVKFNVAKNATLTVSEGASLTLYDSEDWKDNYVFYAYENNTAISGSLVTINPNNAGTARNVVRYSPSRAQVKGTISRANHGSAQLNVDGTLIAYGNVYSTSGWKAPSAESFTANTGLDNVLSGTGTYINHAAYGDVTLNEFYDNSDSSFAKVSTVPLLATMLDENGISETPVSFADATGQNYYGYYKDLNQNGKKDATDYLWTTYADLTTKPVVTVYEGKEISRCEEVVYPGMDLSKYYADADCTNPATEDSEILYVTAAGEACIENSSGVKFYDSLKTAISEAKAGDTVKLLKDVVYSGNGLIIDKTTLDITLDLNNHSITADVFTVLNRGRISIYGGDLKDAEGNNLEPGKLISNGGHANSAALYTQIYDSNETFVGDVTSIGGNLELELKGTGRAAVYNSGAYIGQFGTEGSKITVKSPGLLLHMTSGSKMDALGGAGSYVEMIQTTGQNKNIRAVYNQGTIGIIGDTNAEVRITQNYEYTGGGNPELLTNANTIGAIGGTNATVLMNQYAASGIGFALRVDSGQVTKVGGDHVNRVEIVSSHIPVYVASAGIIDEISTNTLFVAKTQFASQAAIWNVGTIKKINGGWFNSANNTINAIFRTGDNAIGAASAAKSALYSVASGYGLSNKTVSVQSEAMEKAYNCYPVLPVAEIDAEAKNGNVYYDSLDTALKSAKSGETVTMLKDRTTSLYVTTATQNVTLDMNNHSITAGGYALLNRGKISIYGGDLTDAEGNPLEPGRLITTGTSTSLSSCIYNQHYESSSADADTFDAHIYSIGGNLELVDQAGVANGAIYNYGAHIGEIGTEGSKIVVKGSGFLLKMDRGATLDTLGGAGSTVEMIHNAPSTAKTPYAIYIPSGTIDTIGAENATVKITQNSATSGSNHGKLIYVAGTSAVINNIGTASGAKVLMDQTVTGGATGWGLDVRYGGTIHTVGGTDSVVEIIGYGFPVYTDGSTSNIYTVTGNTLMAAKTNYSGGTVSMWMENPIQNVTGGFYAQKGSTHLSDVFDNDAQQQIASIGMTIGESTVKRTSEITGETYDCFYVYGEHTHSATADPEIEWITEDGQVMLRATAACEVSGCHEQIVAKSAATVTGAAEGNTYNLTYSATVSLGDRDYTETKTESLKYGGEKTMQYDDRISGTDIRILEAGEPVETSLKVGTNERDDAVITVYGNKLVATGIGEAVAYIDDAVYEITVEKAIIDLFMITGHSVGMGSQGNTQESVLLDNGQAYSFTVTNTETGGYRYIDVIGETDGVGLGYAAEKRPDEVDNFTAAGGGVIGEDSGLAWKWNQLTGHKVYVVNSAVGSTSMYHWYIDKSNSESPVPILTNAIANFTRARQIIQNEVDAGHFEMGIMTMINHSSANYSDSWGAIRKLYNDEEGQVWFDKVLGDITNAMNKDWDADGTVEKASETMTIGFVPIWTRPKDTVSTSVGIDFGSDKPAVLYMGADAAYADRFVASLIGLQQWGDDAKVQAYFKNYVQEYTAQNGETLAVPSTNLDLYPDYVHYKQFAYNEMGIDVAKNVYTRLYGNTQTVSLKLLKTDGKTEVAADGTEELSLNGSSLKLVPIVDPVSVSDLTFEATGSMGIKWPLTLYAKSAGEGALTISYKGKVLKTLTINVETVARVGETEYLDLAEAIDAAPAGGTVVLLRDIELSTGITVAADKNLTLDLNNHSITVAGTALTNYGTLNILGGEAGEDKTAGALISTSGTAVVNYGHIGTIGGNLMIDAKNAAIHVNHADARIDLIGGENAAITMNAAGNNAIYLQSGTIGTIGATGTGLVTINATNRGILVMSVAPKTDGYDLEAITGNVTINAHGGAIYVSKNSGASKGSSIGTVGGNGTITLDRAANDSSTFQNDGAVHLSSGGYIDALGGTDATVTITSVNYGISMAGGSKIGTIGSTGTGVVDIDTDGVAITLTGTNTKIGTIGGTNGKVDVDSDTTALEVKSNAKIDLIGGTGANVTITQNNTATSGVLKTVYVAGGRIEEIGGTNANVTIEMTDPNPSGTRIAVWVYSGGSIGTLGSGGNVNIICPRIGIFTASGSSGGTVGDSDRGWIENIGKSGVVTIDANTPITIYGNKNRAAIDNLGAGGTVNIIAKGVAIELLSQDALISNIATAGAVNITAGGKAISLGYTGCEITNVGNGGTLTVNSVGVALHLGAGSTVGTLGGTNGEVTLVSSGSYPINIVGGHIGTIGGENAKVNVINDTKTGNTVLLNISNEGSGTVGTIGGEGAEIIFHQRGATTGIQYGILLNGTSTKTAQIDKIGAGAKFVEVIVDDCPVFLDSESEILAIKIMYCWLQGPYLQRITLHMCSMVLLSM